VLPGALLEVPRASAGESAEGNAVTALASDVSLTPAEAAELLGLSRPFVLFPSSMMDLLLDLSEDGVHDVV
jgi:hypothetical protein